MAGVNVKGVGRTLTNLSALRKGLYSGNGWIVGVGAEYGVHLELGTSRMQPYPFLFPAAEQVMAQDFQRLEKQADDVDELIESLALAIEREAKENASGRPGPNVITGYLRSSIEAAPL